MHTACQWYISLPSIYISLKGWTSTLLEDPVKSIILSKLRIQNEKLMVQYSININYDMTWKVYVFGFAAEIPALSEMVYLNKVTDIHILIRKLQSMSLCQGNHDAKFSELQKSKNGLFLSKSKYCIDQAKSYYSICVHNLDKSLAAYVETDIYNRKIHNSTQSVLCITRRG